MMKITSLLVQYLNNPIGIERKRPLLSYSLESDERNQSQTAYCVLVSSTAELLDEHIGDLWDSGKIAASDNFAIEYDGSPLSSRQTAYWKVKVWDRNDIESGWSDKASWEMGLLDERDWEAAWIGQGDDADVDKSLSPQAAVDFQVPDYQNMIQARAYISGLGLFQASLNGRQLDNAFYNPGESDFSKTVYYVAYDITNLLQSGPNAVGIRIGNGQYVNFIVNPVMMLDETTEAPEHRYQKNDGGYVRKGLYGDKKVMAQIEVTYADGRMAIVAATGDHWKITDSPIKFNDWYGGEDYDATAEIDGWDMPGTNRSEWANTKRMTKPLGRLRGREFNPVIMTEKLSAASVTRLANGNLLVDMGRNVAGFPELVLHGTTAADRGTTISMYPAEMLNADKSGVDQASCTQSWSQKYHCEIKNSYTVKGAGVETWHPTFCYQGFQYVEVSGFKWEASVENFNCCVLRVGNEKTGTFETSNQVLNQINEITERAIESNMFYSFTDCPQIEKLGWLETSHLMFRSITAAYDIRSWIPKIAQDMIDAQTDSTDILNGDPEAAGYMPAIAPEYHRIVGLHRDPNWGGACILTPWEYYQVYGDMTVLKDAYSTMKRYLSYLDSHTDGGLLRNYAQMGDWGQLNESTPVLLVENCAYYYLLSTTAKIAALTGHPEDVDALLSRADLVKDQFHRNETCYQLNTGIYGNDSQASYGCVLFSGIVKDENKENAIKKLTEAVEARDDHLTSGEVGLKQVFASLGTNNRNEYVYRMVMNDTQPSYKFFVDHQLTTLPEYWNFEELWLGTMVRSRNHAMMGHVKEWLTAYVLGIRLAAPGYRNIIIEPALTQIIGTAQGSVRCQYGLISVKYTRNEEEIFMEVEIPVGTIANIGISAIGSGNPTTDFDGCTYQKRDQTYWIHDIGSGNYQFKVVF